jgi:prepilin-type N-terminal cleavage/methylation domain-containing protein
MKKGFTLIEILIAIAIVIGVTIAVTASFSNLNKNQALDKDAISVVSVLSKARSLTLSAKDTSQYGVHLEQYKVVLFKGTTYSASDTSNETVNLSSHVKISSINLVASSSEVIFDRLTGKTSQSGTTTLILRTDPSISKVITIFATGLSQSN